MKNQQIILKLIKENSWGKDDLILDAGCGTGDYSILLAKEGYNVIGIDYADGMLFRANKKKELSGFSNLEFRKGDLNKTLQFKKNFFSHILNISVLQTTKEPQFTLNELYRILKNRGILVMLHIPESYEKNKKERQRGIRHKIKKIKGIIEKFGFTRYWTKEEIKEMLLLAGFKDIKCYKNQPIIITAVK
jgi:ubiquinone/menaquinone biosynthesis C-methylase UbiE